MHAIFILVFSLTILIAGNRSANANTTHVNGNRNGLYQIFYFSLALRVISNRTSFLKGTTVFPLTVHNLFMTCRVTHVHAHRIRLLLAFQNNDFNRLATVTKIYALSQRLASMDQIRVGLSVYFGVGVTSNVVGDYILRLGTTEERPSIVISFVGTVLYPLRDTIVCGNFTHVGNTGYHTLQAAKGFGNAKIGGRLAITGGGYVVHASCTLRNNISIGHRHFNALAVGPRRLTTGGHTSIGFCITFL